MPLVSAGYLVPRDVQQDFGFQSAIVSPAPVVGAGWERFTPGEFFEVPVAITTFFTTNAAVFNRTVILQAVNGDGVVVDFVGSSVVQAASQGISYRWTLALTSPYASAGIFTSMPLFAFILPPGFRLRIVVLNLQAGDSFGVVGLVLQQYNTGVEPEKIVTTEPIGSLELGLLSATPLSTPTPTPAPLPYAPAPAPTTTIVSPTATPVATTTSPDYAQLATQAVYSHELAPAPTAPTYQELADAAAIGGSTLRQ